MTLAKNMSKERSESAIRTAMSKTRARYIHQRLDKVTLASRIFSGNAVELEASLRIAEDPTTAMALIDYNDRSKFKAFIEQVLRQLHNYTASAKTLVEHSRPVFKDVLPELLWNRYSDRVSRDFANNPVARFIQQLGDYSLHWRTPEVGLNLTILEGSKEVTTLNMFRDELLKWDKWNPISRTFIQSSEPDISLHFVVRTYTQTVSSFMQWNALLVEEGFKEEFDELRKLQKELYDVLEADGGSIPEYIRQQYS